MLIKLVETAEGRIGEEEVFETFKDLKKYLIENDFFSWILDEEPNA